MDIVSLMAGGSVMGYVFQFITSMRKHSQEKTKMMILLNEKRDESQKQYFDQSQEETPSNSMLRQILTITLISLFTFLVVAGLFTDTNVQIINRGFSIFGFEIIPDHTEWVKMAGLIAYPEIQESISAFVGFYFGKEAAK